MYEHHHQQAMAGHGTGSGSANKQRASQTEMYEAREANCLQVYGFLRTVYEKFSHIIAIIRLRKAQALSFTTSTICLEQGAAGIYSIRSSAVKL